MMRLYNKVYDPKSDFRWRGLRRFAFTSQWYTPAPEKRDSRTLAFSRRACVREQDFSGVEECAPVSGVSSIFQVGFGLLDAAHPYGGKGMKLASIAALWFGLQMVPVPALARGTIKEADYPVEYEVMNSSKTAKLVIEKQCSMTLRNRARANVDLNVARTGFGSCHVLESGKVYRGRENQKKNQIELVILGFV